MRSRWGALLVAVPLGLACLSGEARAAATVHRLSLVLSGIPTQVSAKDYNEFLERFNSQRLEPAGVEGIETFSFAWLFDAQLRYFVRPNVAVSAGVGQLRNFSSREFLPGINQDVQLRAEILSVPVHVGGAYYLQPYNQGDFQARGYFGAGFMSLVYNRGRLQQVATGFDSATGVAQNFKLTGQRDSPGYYVEGGVHMFFAVRYSVMLGVIYRSARIRDMQGYVETGGQRIPVGRVFDLDTSGVGVRMGVAVGF